MIDEQDPAISQEGAREDASTVTDPQVTEEAAESSEESGEGAGAPQDDQDAETLEIVVAGEEPPPQKDPAPAWVKDLRKENRELKAWKQEVERQKAQGQAAQADDPGPKPTLEGCDFDAGAFEKNLESWHERRKRKDATDAQASQAADANRRAWQSRLDTYAKSKDELSKQLPDYADAETAVNGALDVTQQGVLLHCADNAALVVCALGQNPKLLEDAAKEKDPIRFAVKVAKLEARLKTQKKSQVPPPEKPVSGTGAVSGGKDSTLERLRAQADKSGDRTPVTDYLRKKREASRG